MGEHTDQDASLTSMKGEEEGKWVGRKSPRLQGSSEKALVKLKRTAQ